MRDSITQDHLIKRENMNTRGFIGLLILALAMAGLFVGCGSDGTADTSSSSSSAQGSGKPLTVAAYKKRAYAICGKAGEEILQKIGQRFEGAPVKNEAEAYEELRDSVFIPQLEAELEELRSLPAPDASAEDMEAMLDALEDGVEDLERAQVKSLSDVSEAFPKFDQLATSNGLRGCRFGSA